MNFIFLVSYTIIVMMISIYIGLRLYKREETLIDKKIRDYFQEKRSGYLMKLMESITKLGNVETLFMIIVPILFFLIRGGEYVLASAVIMAAGLSIVVSQSLKILFRRHRPVKKNQMNYRGYSFPSGHSTVGLSFYLTLAYLLAWNGSGVYISILIIGLLVGLLIAFSRVYIGVHWASDVLIGILLGLMCAFWSIYLYRQGFILELIFKETVI